MQVICESNSDNQLWTSTVQEVLSRSASKAKYEHEFWILNPSQSKRGHIQPALAGLPPISLETNRLQDVSEATGGMDGNRIPELQEYLHQQGNTAPVTVTVDADTAQGSTIFITDGRQNYQR